MAYDPATKRLFIPCVADGSLEGVDLDAGKRIGTIAQLPGPQGVAVAGSLIHVATGDDGRQNRFKTLVTKSARSVKVRADADNVRIARDGETWASFGGGGLGGLAGFDDDTMRPDLKPGLPRMPEGFQLHPSADAVFANVPAGERSEADSTVLGFKCSTGEHLWERMLTGRAGTFSMMLDAANDRLFVVARRPARPVSLNTRDGSVLGETASAPAWDVLSCSRSQGGVGRIRRL